MDPLEAFETFSRSDYARDESHGWLVPMDARDRRTRLDALSKRMRLEFLRGAEEEWVRRSGRPMDRGELTRVLSRYPGDWLERPGRGEAGDRDASSGDG
jgi:hypothetical protein